MLVQTWAGMVPEPVKVPAGVMPAGGVTVQLYTVPATDGGTGPNGTAVMAVPEHMVWGVIAFTVGDGFTVTT